MFINSKLAKSIRLALAAGVVATVFSSSSLFAQEAEITEEEVSETVERVTVTGSRIKRADMEGALPVTVIDREAIEFSGQTSVADLLRNTSFNSTGSFRPQSGSSAQGVSSVNLRGLGSSRTLVLVDGRRLPKSPSTGSSQDLNAIPVAAVERVEILTDGASAIYGSDAIGGVINIITRKDFNGVELKLGASEVEHEGGSREEGSIVFGTSSDKGSIIGGVSWNNRDIIFARDLPWYNPGGSIYGNSFTTLDSNGDDNFNWTALPGACNDGPGFYLLASGGALANSAGTQERCAYNFALESADEASTGVIGFFMNSRYEVNDDWSIFSSMSINKTSSFGRYAPVPDSNYFSEIPLTTNSPNNPTNPNSSMYDPAFGEPQEVNWWHRFDSLGNRDSEVDNELSDLTVGAEGQVGDMFIDFGLRRTKNKTFDIGRNYLVRTTAEAYIENGTYDLSNPSGNSDDVLNAMKAVISRISSYDQDEAFASVQFDMFDMDAGAVTTYIGAEYRKEIYSDQYDSLSEAGQIGGSAGNSAGGSRNSKALFFETLIPVLEELEVSVAGRYDSYSDYGNDFSPKISFKYTPIDDLIVRASFGKGFRAPSLDILTQKDSFSATSVSDVRTCQAQSQPDDCSTQINNIIVANPELQSEQSNQFAVGFAYEPIDNLSFSVDYFDIEITNRITSFGASTILARDQAGDFIPPGLGVTRAGNGAILEVISGYGNEGTRQTEGLDINVRYMVDTDFGTIRSNFQTFYGLSDKVDGGRDFYNDPGQPDYRGVWSNIYSVGDFDVAYNLNFIASTAEDIVDGLDEGHIPSWITHDLQVNYNAPWDAKITIGSSNITGKEPPLFSFGGRDYNFNLYDGYGRVVYARYTQSF
jgi:iron complex outermembrane receptor protein